MGSAEKQGKLWGTAVADWAEINERFVTPYWHAMLEDMDVKEGCIVFDAGCGAGGGAKIALDLGANVYGLDASEEMISFAKANLPEADFRVGDLEDLPFEDNFFDAVIAANSVQYAENPQNALKEIRRVCKPDGKISVCTWDVKEKNEYRFLQAATAKLSPEPPKPGTGPYALAEPGKLEAFVESAGMKVVSGESVPIVYHYKNLDMLNRAVLSAGNAQILANMVGVDKIKRALSEFYDEYKDKAGEVRLNNMFRFVTAVPV